LLNPVYAQFGVSLDVVLPNPNHQPTSSTKGPKILLVPLAAARDLVFPVGSELASPCRKPPAMPKVAVHEDCDL
jgi:hypothetical protein